MVLSEPQVDAQTGEKVSRHQSGRRPEILLQNPAAGLFNRAKAYRRYGVSLTSVRTTRAGLTS
jgi:hypothetical protein